MPNITNTLGVSGADPQASLITNTGLSAMLGEGNVSVIHKFGRTPDLTTSFTPVAIGNVYPTPSTPQSLEFVSDNLADALDDSGMHELTIIGIGPDWREQTAVVAAHATTGTTAVAIPGTWLRVYRAYVSSSGTYGSSTAGSHAGTITIRVASAGATWAQISGTDFPRGQSEIGVYTVPLGFTAYLASVFISVNTSQTVDAVVYRRENADDVTASYSGTVRATLDFDGLSGPISFAPRTPIGPCVGPCDIGIMAKGAANNDISADFELILVPNGE